MKNPYKVIPAITRQGDKAFVQDARSGKFLTDARGDPEIMSRESAERLAEACNSCVGPPVTQTGAPGRERLVDLR